VLKSDDPDGLGLDRIFRLAGEQFEYAFDDIGNRRYAGNGGNEWGSGLRYQNYTVNNLNQYSQRTVQGGFDLIGSATNTATVTVNTRTTYRKGDYFRNDYTADNTAGPLYVGLTNVRGTEILGLVGEGVAGSAQRRRGQSWNRASLARGDDDPSEVDCRAFANGQLDTRGEPHLCCCEIVKEKTKVGMLRTDPNGP